MINWNAELKEYNYKIIYKPGPSNHADALSRRPNYDIPMENPEVICFPERVFSADTPEQRELVAAIALGWSRVTAEEMQ